ncbi:PREDICTED: BAG family molecular chaperone regulator 3 [Camelina sativa]|uniref:BAG family molecular chaperone regulator 3 n=1 Tax=Camelina sativa TaxID=90675 RepID=A0ABM0XUT7_CAMSA|nr:PREDICTED: BAG family molecular chaperone regulator 3 [Camelina sativa]
MMKMKTGSSPTSVSGGGGSSGNEWEYRPGGMVVQRRTDQNSELPRVIRVRVKYASVYHEININSQSTFGELKKMLSDQVGLHHEDMKVLYKDKERDSKMFLDLCGVKDRSKLVVKEDPISQEKRLLEKRKNAAVEKASKSISDISLEVDRLAGQVSAFETVINKGGKVEEKSLVNLIELLMNQLLRLDAIMGDGDVKLKRKMQVQRVQKYVEALDVLKVKNSAKKVEMINKSVRHKPKTQTQFKQRDLLSFVDEEEEEEPRNSNASSSGGTPGIGTNKWEMFDSASAAKAAETVKPVPPRYKWEFFD